MRYNKAEQEARKQEAEKIARMLFGVWDWQGIRDSVYGTPGLARLANQYLKNSDYPKGWRVGEVAPDYDDPDYFEKYANSAHFGDSRYYIKSF